MVCSTEIADRRGDFFLSVYFNCPLRDFALKRIFHPADNRKGQDEILPSLIPEEAEKMVSQTPQWKILLVKESLKWMVTDEDPGN